MKRLLLGLVAIITFVPPYASQAQGRYIGRHGVSPGRATEGSHTAKLDFEPFSSTYLPAKKGQLVTETDNALADQLWNGFVAGRCDIVSDAVKTNATLPSGEKFDLAVEKETGFDPKLAQYYEGSDDFANQHDLLNSIRRDMLSLHRALADLDRRRASMGFGEYIGELSKLRTQLIKTHQRLIDSQQTYVPSFVDFVRVLYFEGQFPMQFGDPARYGRWRGYRPEAASWEGFCHNWAPAGLDPAARLIVATDRIFGEVPFGVGDLRELTTYLRPDGNETFFGKRNWGDGNYDHSRDDLTPVDVHALLTHYVGPGKPGIVFDIDPGPEVWNQPVYRYEYQAYETSSRPHGLKTVVGGKVLEVGMSFDYANEVGDYASRGPTQYKTRSLQYVLSTDEHGNVVDGRWIGQNRIPDFAAAHDHSGRSAAFAHLQEVSSKGIAVSKIETVCEKLWSLPRNRHERRAILRDLKSTVSEIAPVVDARRFNSYLRAVARERRIDYSNLVHTIGI